MKHDDVTWTRNVEPRERYRLVYIDSHEERSDRTVELLKLGDLQGTPYLGVLHQGKFKTLRADRVVEVEQLSTGHEPSLRAWPQLSYASHLPQFPVEHALYKVATIAASHRTWTADLNRYTCTCPEKRIRAGFGYAPGQLGSVCPHMARAILEHLPGNAGWPEEILLFLRNPRKVHIDSLV